MRFLKSLGFTFICSLIISMFILGTSVVKDQFELMKYTSQFEKMPYTYAEESPKKDLKKDSKKQIDKRIPKKKSISVLVLRKKNTLVLNEVVTSKSVAKLQVELLKMSNILPKKGIIYLVLNTPGGSVGAGSLLIDTIRAIPQEVKTVSIFSASMGFQIVQNAGERLILPSGVLMSHRASIRGLGGEIFGELDSRLEAIKSRVTQLDLIASERMGLSLKDYRSLIADELWVHGFESVQKKVADKMILARCDKSLSGSYIKRFRTFFGPVDVKFSNCPLIVGPLEVNFSKVKKTKKERVRKFFSKLFEDRESFVKDYILNNNYNQILRD